MNKQPEALQVVTTTFYLLNPEKYDAEKVAGVPNDAIPVGVAQSWNKDVEDKYRAMNPALWKSVKEHYLNMLAKADNALVSGMVEIAKRAKKG